MCTKCGVVAGEEEEEERKSYCVRYSLKLLAWLPFTEYAFWPKKLAKYELVKLIDFIINFFFILLQNVVYPQDLLSSVSWNFFTTFFWNYGEACHHYYPEIFSVKYPRLGCYSCCVSAILAKDLLSASVIFSNLLWILNMKVVFSSHCHAGVCL